MYDDDMMEADCDIFTGNGIEDTTGDELAYSGDWEESFTDDDSEEWYNAYPQYLEDGHLDGMGEE